MKNLAVFSFLFIISQSLWCSTHPLTGSSLINHPDNSLAFTQMGFKVSGIPEYWQFHKTIEGSGPSIEIGTPAKMLLSFRSEKVSAKIPLEGYVRQYLKDYNQYGLEVSGLQSGNDVVTIELTQKNKASRTRQMFFHKDNNMIIATCTDDSVTFETTSKICSHILSTFQWR
jgi:hypothetical protein